MRMKQKQLARQKRSKAVPLEYPSGNHISSNKLISLHVNNNEIIM